jgi:hypothetical protein
MVLAALVSCALALLPALVDGILDEVVVVGVDAPDEEHLPVVLDGDVLGVVDARLTCQPLALGVHLQPHRQHTQGRLVGHRTRLVRWAVHDAVLLGLGTLLASLTPVREDGPGPGEVSTRQ